MAKALSLPNYLSRKHHHGDDDIIERLTVSVHENYFTFSGWDVKENKPGTGETLTRRLYQNFATFMEWGK